jgi:hypothetical protein
VAVHQGKPLEPKEYPDEADVEQLAEADEAPGLARCPACGKSIFEGSPQCPHCREWIYARQDWRASRKWYIRGGLYLTRTLLANWIAWIVLAALAALAAVVALLEARR